MTRFFLLFTVACTNGKIGTGDAFESATADSTDRTPEEGDDGMNEYEEESESQDDEEAEEAPSDEEAPSEQELDTGHTETESESTEEELAEPETEEERVSLVEYVTTYCDTFAVPCMGGFLGVEDCVDRMMEIHFTDCTVVNYTALAECDEWVSTIECDETYWLPACDDFIECP